MKLGRIILHAAFGFLILVGFAGSVVTAEGTTSKSSTKSSSNSGSSSSSTPVKATGSSSVQSFAAVSKLQVGTVVELAGGKKNTVEPATSKNLDQMYGAVVDPHDLSLTVSNASLQNETFVTINGTYKVLVNTQNGTIKIGDYITMSALDGVTMKAGTYQDQHTVFGRAIAGFDGKTNIIGTATLKDSSGKSIPVSIGLIPVAINIQRNPNQKSTKTNLPPILQRIGQAIAEKPIGPLRMYLSIAVTGLSVMIAITVLYSGVRNSIISIGRNPLSKKSIFRGLLEIILTAFLILIIGLFAVYLLLKL
jgi:hypothetical protein